MYSNSVPQSGRWNSDARLNGVDSKGCLQNNSASALFERAANLAGEASRYLTLMYAAPPLIAESLDDPYRRLCKFGDSVLGGMESPYGVQFTTWQRTYDGKGLTWGHYCGNDFGAAVEDFAQRAGFMDHLCLFSKE